MRRDLLARQTCSVARSAAVVGDPWALLIIREAFLGHRRFADFVEFTGAQPSVVSDRLKRLVESGVLERIEYQQHPSRHEYRLTDMGRDLQPVLVALTLWGDAHLDGGDGPPLRYTHAACGHDADPTLVCGHCAEPLDGRSLRAHPGPGADPAEVERRRR